MNVKHGTAGPDTIHGDTYTTSLVYPNSNKLEITGVSLDDIIWGGDGNDYLLGGYGSNELHGGSGDDRLSFGGSSIHLAPYFPTPEIQALLASPAATGPLKLFGEDGDDILHGGPRSDLLDGGAGADRIEGGGGDDLIRASAGADGIDGGLGFDTVAAIAANQRITLSALSGVERITAGGLANVSVWGTAAGEKLDFSSTTLTGITAIYGGGGRDTIVGSAGRDIIYTAGAVRAATGTWTDIDGGSGDDLIVLTTPLGSSYSVSLAGGAGNDVIDLSRLPGALPEGHLVWIDGDAERRGTAGDFDTLILPGRPDQYDVGPKFNSVDQYWLSTTSGGSAFVWNVDKVEFSGKLANQVRLGDTPIAGGSPLAHIYLEQMRLIGESYGSKQGYHRAEVLFGDEDAPPLAWSSAALPAAERNWHKLSPLELGIAPVGESGGLRYSLVDGDYRAIDLGAPTLDGDPSEANATILTGLVDGKRTLAITFRGTDQLADWLDYGDFGRHYAKFAPLIVALNAYLSDPRVAIEQVLVSGHSLGGAMVQEFMATHADGQYGVAVFRALTIGSPGSDNAAAGQADSRILTVGNASDPVFLVDRLPAGAIVDSLMLSGVLGLAGPVLKSLIGPVQDKERSGTDLVISSSEISTYLTFDAHDDDLYARSFATLLGYAFDRTSPFHASAVATGLRRSGSYQGPEAQIAIITSRDRSIDLRPADGFVLGSAGDDNIRMSSGRFRIIDGGAGMDTLFLPLAFDWTWSPDGANYILRLDDRPAAQLARIERLVFAPFVSAELPPTGATAAAAAASPPLPPVVRLDGKPVLVQRPAAGQAQLTVDANADYVDAGASPLSIDGSAGDDIVLLGGPQTVAAGGGDDLVMTAPAGLGGHAAFVKGGPGADRIAAAAGTSGTLVAQYSGYWFNYAVTAIEGGGILVEDMRPSDPGGSDLRDSHDGIDTLFGPVQLEFFGRAAALPDLDPIVRRGTAANDVIEADSRAAHIFGGAGADRLHGGAGGDILNGGANVDQLHGGPGDDQYVVDYSVELVVEMAGAGYDVVYADGTSFSLPANVEKLAMIATPLGDGRFSVGIYGTGNALSNVVIAHDWGATLSGRAGDDTLTGGDGQDDLFGEEGADRLFGEAGDDRIDGGEGADWMTGGSGNDAYTVDHASDRVAETGAGLDTVRSSVSYRLPAGVENLVLAGMAPINGYGNGAVNALAGNSAANRLDGGPGADRMAGGGGNEVYAVDDAGDEVVELADGGSDRVESRIDYTLPAFVERLTLAGVAARGTGNALANVLVGNAAANLLDGAAGPDRMEGGAGDDLYLVDLSSDLIVESSGNGNDSARSSASYTLPDHVENLVLAGGGNIDGRGNGLANALSGNGGHNRLDGKGGADTLAGGSGHDVYVVDHGGDRVIESGSAGTDTVLSAVGFTLPAHVEKLILTGTSGIDGRGNSGANTITGNSAGNFLNGGSGNDIIDAGAGNDRILGGAGNDSLKGGAGIDRFEFTAALGGANVDRILDFSVVSDTIYLMRSVFTRAGANGALAAAAFHNGSAAHDASDRIVYDPATGRVFYDADGSGAAAAILFATVTPGTALTHADFIIYG